MLLKRLRTSLFFRKASWSLLIIAIYMLGAHILIPTAPVESIADSNKDLSKIIDSLSMVTGGRSTMTLFSLGLAPYMNAMIIWRLANVLKWDQLMTKTQRNAIMGGLTLVLGFIQAFGMTLMMPFRSDVFFGHTVSAATLQLLTVIFMVTGSSVLTWLASINTDKGIGGMIIIILVNMLNTLFSNFNSYISANRLKFSTDDWIQQGILFVIGVSLLIWLAVVTYRGEYRQPIYRTGINSPDASLSYLPIRVTPAGAMPYMYGMTLMILPPIIFTIINQYMPGNHIIQYLLNNSSSKTLAGAIMYAIILYALAIGFAYFNYDAYEIAKEMRDSGDYIEHVRVGRPTQKYLHRKIAIFARFGAIFTVLLGAGPNFFMLGIKNGEVNFATIISSVYIVSTFMFTIIEQVDALLGWRKYKNVI